MMQKNSRQLRPKPTSTLSALLLLLLVLVTWCLLFPQAGWAQAAQPVTTTVTIDQVNLVARELWCPLCSGVRLDVCELKACEQMREEIALKLTAGENLDQIKAYFLERYGPQVLGKPPLEGFNWLAWLMPFAVLLGGGLFVLVRNRNLFRSAPPVVRPVQAGAPAKVEEEAYLRQLEEELKQHDQ